LIGHITPQTVSAELRNKKILLVAHKIHECLRTTKKTKAKISAPAIAEGRSRSS